MADGDPANLGMHPSHSQVLVHLAHRRSEQQCQRSARLPPVTTLLCWTNIINAAVVRRVQLVNITELRTLLTTRRCWIIARGGHERR